MLSQKTRMGSFNLKYVGGISLIEVWLILALLLTVFLSMWTSWLVFPLLIMSIPVLRFAFMFLLSIVFACFAADGRKDVLLRMIRVALDQVWQIEADLPSDLTNTVIIANYPACLSEYLILPIILREIGSDYCLVAGSTAGFWTGLFLDKHCQIKLQNKGNHDNLGTQLAQHIKSGRVPIIYPERNVMARETHDTLQEFRTGIFDICAKAKYKILLIRITHLTLNGEAILIKSKFLDGHDPTKARQIMQTM